MRTLFIILLAVTITGLASCSRNKEGDNYTTVKDDDAAMNAAIATAKATATNFVQAFHAKKPGAKNFSVKKPYPEPKGGQEHMWIDVTEENNGVLKGTIANEAEDTREVKLGQAVTLNISEISDWMYVDNKKLMGGYTLRYFIERMSPKEKQEFLQQMGFEL